MGSERLKNDSILQWKRFDYKLYMFPCLNQLILIQKRSRKSSTHLEGGLTSLRKTKTFTFKNVFAVREQEQEILLEAYL